LGLDVHRFSDHVIYIKHPTTKTFVVCAVRQNAPVFSPNFRNTLSVASRDEVKAAYREFSDPGKTLPVSELFELKETDVGTSFCFRDHGSNCWELATTN
jgi:hypothetical protein